MSNNSRLEPFTPDQLDQDQRKLYKAICEGPRRNVTGGHPPFDESGRLRGPFNAMLLSPSLGHALQNLGAAIRFETSLPIRAREIATLVTARHRASEYEWQAHERLARAAGVTDAEIDSIVRDAPRFDDESEQLIAEVALMLASEGRLEDGEYARAVEVLGTGALFEVVTLVGYYGLLASVLEVFGFLA